MKMGFRIWAYRPARNGFDAELVEGKTSWDVCSGRVYMRQRCSRTSQVQMMGCDRVVCDADLQMRYNCQ